MNEKYLVTQANDLIVSRHNLTTTELKVVLTLVSLVQPEDNDFKLYKLKISEFAEMLGLTGESQYTYLNKITQDLMQKTIELKSKKRTLQMTWLASTDYKYGEGIIELEISQKLRPYLLMLKECFTSYALENILRLNSKYSIRLYEILKSNEYKKTVIIEITELSKTLKLGSVYNDFHNIKRRIIEPARKELAEKTDITFDYETITQRKKVIALKFTIEQNPNNKPQKLLQEPLKQLKEPNSNTQPTSQSDNIKALKAEFQRLYKGELVDKFVMEMIQEKGLSHVQECLRTYSDYIKYQDIRNIGGYFKKFVMEGYVKPVQQKGNKPQRDNFEQREYSREQCEKWEYAFLEEQKNNTDVNKK